ncbi:MAG TPA: tetratricopeptide repeat protein [Nitrospirota bacterium]|nr:tetratricopeptide repeat protein [Nitrospirota bacterium]
MTNDRCLKLLFALSLLFVSCQTPHAKDTLASLRGENIDIKEERIEGGLDKAMEGYQRFLEETPGSSKLKPEAMRRLADLKIEKEYGLLPGVGAARRRNPGPVPRVPATVQNESQADFEKRAGALEEEGAPVPENLERPGAREAIALYQKLLTSYPHYEHNDQALYQMSRAYEELGEADLAMKVMDRMVRDYPKCQYMDEVQFRRAEYFFTRKRYPDAEDAYQSVVHMGAGSYFYQLALYKLGWAFYKQELYDEALDRYIALLDYKVGTGYDFAQTKDKMEKKRIDDTFRVISLCFSNLGGPKTVAEYFAKHGSKSYEDGIYSNLGEFYFDKRRYADAAATYNAFVGMNPFHRKAPEFQMRVIDIDIAGGFPSLVIDAKKEFARTYGLNAPYWKHYQPAARPEVLSWLKTNLTDLAKHYHALYQDKEKVKDKETNYQEAMHWYRQFLASYPKDADTPAVNYLLADLLMENGAYGLAAAEYEKTSYDYPPHEKSAQAGYAAVYAYRQELNTAAPEQKDEVKRKAVASSLKFAETYPEHEKAAIVLGAAADDLYGMRDYEQALASARKLVLSYPKADADVVREAYVVVGHSTYDLHRYAEAEAAYVKVLSLLPAGDTSRDGISDNLAAAIYKQGEQASTDKDYRAAADNFLRVGRMVPASKIRVNAEYDAATALILLKDWKTATSVLAGFREKFPGSDLLPEVTKKIAYVYREDGKLGLAAGEYERIEAESKDDDIRRASLLTAAELYDKAGNRDRELAAYRRYVDHFPHPAEPNMETRAKIAEILKTNGVNGYLAELKEMVAIDASAGAERTPRTRYLAGTAALVLAEQTFGQFSSVKLVEPFKANLEKKKELMEAATQEFGKLLDYENGLVTSAATFYLAEIYADFSRELKESERPRDLGPAEREEYEQAIDSQASPFEEKAIQTHKSNLELISRGIYNEWIEKSLQKLAKLVPARYDKTEEESAVITLPDTYLYAVKRQEEPAPLAVKGAAQSGEPKLLSSPSGTSESAKSAEKKQEQNQADTSESVKTAVPTKEGKPAETKEKSVGSETAQEENRAESPETVQDVHPAENAQDNAVKDAPNDNAPD